MTILYFDITGTLENNEEVPPKLQELHDNVCSIILEYTVFLDIFVSFLKNVKRVNFCVCKMIVEYDCPMSV